MEAQNSSTLMGAPFSDRFAAKLVDGALLLVPNLMLHFSTIPFLGPFLLSFLYYVFFEASPAQATPGKRLAGIRVISQSGGQITLVAASVRMVFRSLSTALLFLPYLAMLFTRSRQTAHDLLSDTFVVTGKTDELLIESWLKPFEISYGTFRPVLKNKDSKLMQVILTLVLMLSVACIASADEAVSGSTDKPHQWQITAEGGPAWQARNDFRIPSETGTLVKLADQDSGASFAYRLYAGYRWGSEMQHEVRALYAPLTVKVASNFANAVSFQGQTFAAATPTDSTYQFNSYRVTYRYRFYNGESWKWFVGFTGKIRDAKIALSQAGVSAEKKDVGFVPLLHLNGEWIWSENWSLVLDIDALAAPQGRAEDILLAVHWKPLTNWNFYSGYRTVEGGADNRDVFTFAWLHYLAVGAQYHW